MTATKLDLVLDWANRNGFELYQSKFDSKTQISVKATELLSNQNLDQVWDLVRRAYPKSQIARLKRRLLG
jgi:hypothetical protein